MGRRKHVPIRTCVACRRQDAKGELIRVVRQPDGTVRVDERGKLPGRGSYLCPDPACWTRALGKKNLLARALRTELAPSVRQQLLEYALERFSAPAAAGQRKEAQEG